jgi:hypothetical protein
LTVDRLAPNKSRQAANMDRGGLDFEFQRIGHDGVPG